MNRVSRRLFVLSLVPAFSCSSAAVIERSAAQTADLRVVGYYFAPTIRRGFPVSAIQAQYLTHINYAFGNIGADGRAQLGYPCFDIGECAAGEANPNPRRGGNFAELRVLKQRFPQLHTLISIGGWGWSARFSDVAVTPQARARFVESVLDVFIRSHPGVFDGVDLDWEYPVSGGLPTNRYRPEDRANYTLLLSDFRRALDAQGRRDNRRYLLTIAAPAGPSHLRNFELDRLVNILDFINVMTYDYHTAGKIAHFNAPLGAAAGDPTPELNVRATVASYLAAGVPRGKLVIGVPFFGYGYGGVGAERNGLFQPAQTNGMTDPPGTTPWVGAVRYHEISKARQAGFERHWEPAAGVPWLYHRSSRTWITYDDAQSLALKADLVRERGLGGLMIWELSGDDRTLLPALHRRLNH